MQIDFRQLPFYIQLTFKLAMLTLLCVLLNLGSSLFVPLAFSIILAILLLPLTHFLQRRLRLAKGLADIASVLVSIALIATLIWFLSREIASFLHDIPSIKSHLRLHYETLQEWIKKHFHISESKQAGFISNAADSAGTSGRAVIGATIFTITHLLFYVVMVAIYTFLILHYRATIKRFLLAVFRKEAENDVTEVLEESKAIIQKYMLGLITEMAIVAVVLSTVLICLGVKYAIFLGVFAAILNIIPYIGIQASMLFACLVTLTTSAHLDVILWIFATYEIVHFVDSNFLMTRIVGAKVRINALITILGVVAGDLLIGLPGIFLALPVIAILKIIFDRVESLKPWGLLMGDEHYEHTATVKRLKRKAARKARSDGKTA